MNEKSFHSITVTDITKVADINRATFYSHFKDKYDLLEQVVDEILREFEGIITNYYASKDHTKKPIDLYISIFLHIKQRGNFYKLTLNSEKSLKFWKKLLEVFYETVQKNKQMNAEELSIPRDFLNSFVSAAFIGVIMNWLKNDMHYSPEFMAENTYHLISKLR